METESKQYKEYLLGKYLPGRSVYLRKVLYPKYLRALGDLGGREVYDLGCGGGDFLRFCRERHIPAIGVDSNESLVGECRKQGLSVVLGDVTHFDLDGRIRNAVCDNVLEHLSAEQIDAFFVNAKRLAEPGAKMLIVVPGTSGFRKDPTHKTFIATPLMRTLADRHGVRIEREFYAPFNVRFMGNVLYLNMTIFKVIF